jgi:hypothetical protein
MEKKEYITNPAGGSNTFVPEGEWLAVCKKPSLYRMKSEAGWLVYSREKNDISYQEALVFVPDSGHVWEFSEDDLQKESTEGLPKSNSGGRSHHLFSIKVPGGVLYRKSSGKRGKSISLTMTLVGA